MLQLVLYENHYLYWRNGFKFDNKNYRIVKYWRLKQITTLQIKKELNIKFAKVATQMLKNRITQRVVSCTVNAPTFSTLGLFY